MNDIQKEIIALNQQAEFIKKLRLELIEELDMIEKKCRAREKYLKIEAQLTDEFFTPEHIEKSGGFYDRS